MEGLRESLKLLVGWPHVDLLIRTFNERIPAPRKGTKVAKESISKSTFVSVLWPLVSKKSFDHMMQHPSLIPGTNQIEILSASSMQKSLTTTDSMIDIEEKESKSSSELGQESVIYEYDL